MNKLKEKQMTEFNNPFTSEVATVINEANLEKYLNADSKCVFAEKLLHSLNWRAPECSINYVKDLFEDLHNELSPPENIPPAAQTAIDSFKADIAGQEAWLRTPALTACSWVVGRDGIFVSAILDENKNTTGEHRINVNPLDATRYSRETANKLAAVTNNGNGQMKVYTLHEAVNEALDVNRKAVKDLIKLFRDAAKN